jgi:hypothetical protein
MTMKRRTGGMCGVLLGGLLCAQPFCGFGPRAGGAEKLQAEIGAVESTTLAAQVPDEARRQLVEAFGPRFRVFRDQVQGELKLSVEQKEKLEQRIMDTIQEAMRFFETLEGLKPEEREKKFAPYRQDVQEKLAAFLKETLKPDQRKRFRQLELQQEGMIALGQPEVADELKLSQEQRKQFMAIVQDLQKKAETLFKEAQSAGKPEGIRSKVMAIRKEHEGKIEATLTDAQKKQWREMLGEPFAFED